MANTDREWKDLQTAQWIAESLFVNGQGEQADRLVLTSADGKDLGGWCRRAVVDQIMKTLDEVRQVDPVPQSGKDSDD